MTMVEKQLIAIIGTSTAGKTTLAKALAELIDVVFIPETTCRNPRLDDDARFTRLCTLEEFAARDFIARDHLYGIERGLINKFSHSDNLNAVIVTNPPAMVQLKEQNLQGISLRSVFLRLSHDLKKERAIAAENMRKYFSHDSARAKFFVEKNEEYFLNPAYQQTMDLCLARENGLSSWIISIAAQFTLPLKTKNAHEIESVCARIISEGKRERIGTSYPSAALAQYKL